MNDQERIQWVDNDEGLHNEWKRSKLSKREFVKRNRAMLTEAINNVTSGKKPAHYLAYPSLLELINDCKFKEALARLR